MSSQLSTIIHSIIVLISALFGFWTSYFIQKLRQKQTRVDIIFERRMKVYGEALGFIYEVEQHQTDADELERIIERWKKWYPTNVLYLPPEVNDAFFGAMYWTIPVIVDLKNKQTNEKTWRLFRERLHDAKTKLMSLSDIGWLPEALK